MGEAGAATLQGRGSGNWVSALFCFLGLIYFLLLSRFLGFPLVGSCVVILLWNSSGKERLDR